MNAGILLRPIFFLSIITFFISEVSGQSLTDSLISSGYRKTEIDNFEGAMRDFEIALSLQPLNNSALNGKITVLYLQGNTREARRLVDRAISDNPDFAGFYYTRGMISNQRRNYRRAIDDFDKALELQEVNQSRVYLNRGISKLNLENPDSAIEDFELAIDSNPQNISAYNYRGMVNYRNNRYDLAIEDFDRIININPLNDVAYYNRGMAFLRSGDPGNACVDFHTACQIGSRSACQMIIMECQ